MAVKTIVLCAQVLLIQSALGQVINGNNWYRSGGVSSASAAAESSVAVTNNAGLGLIAPGVGLANTGLISSGLGLANTGVISTGLANSAVIGNTLLPAPNAGFLDIASFSTSGTLPINSFSPIAPAGISVLSQNTIEGPLTVIGQLPFLSAVALDGTFATEGAGAAGCGCGTVGNIGIIEETFAPIAAPAIGGIGIGAGLGRGFY
ncbi:chorion class B protein Ld34-like [Achroia grisella]|uniref:chorion class B protein Ld34-like n=1 Tax=Achroia grisella TaxID=688607 RepID=UPI0027D23F76|nr:chorion class B protein Ld34-like [Achroia grisella]